MRSLFFQPCLHKVCSSPHPVISSRIPKLAKSVGMSSHWVMPCANPATQRFTAMFLNLPEARWTEEWLRVAEVANILSSDVSILKVPSLKSLSVSGVEALSNPFFEEISSLYSTLESDVLVPEMISL